VGHLKSSSEEKERTTQRHNKMMNKEHLKNFTIKKYENHYIIMMEEGLAELRLLL
jgi:hypothetical protein